MWTLLCCKPNQNIKNTDFSRLIWYWLPRHILEVVQSSYVESVNSTINCVLVRVTPFVIASTGVWCSWSARPQFGSQFLHRRSSFSICIFSWRTYQSWSMRIPRHQRQCFGEGTCRGIIGSARNSPRIFPHVSKIGRAVYSIQACLSLSFHLCQNCDLACILPFSHLNFTVKLATVHTQKSSSRFIYVFVFLQNDDWSSQWKCIVSLGQHAYPWCGHVL